MFIKKTKNSKGQTYYHIAESYWKDGKSKHRMLEKKYLQGTRIVTLELIL